MIATETVTATPNPSALQVTSAAGVASVVGYGASLLAAKYGVPPEVTMAVLGAIVTAATSLWHRLFGPKVPVSKPV